MIGIILMIRPTQICDLGQTCRTTPYYRVIALERPKRPESTMSVDSDTDLESDSLSVISNEDDKWSVMDGLDYTGSSDDINSSEYNLTFILMFNYEVQSKADSIIKAMEKETVPARVPVCQYGDSPFPGYCMTLREYLKTKKPNIRIRCLLLAQLLEGMVHLCQHGISRRDIESDNLFIEIPDDHNAVPRLVIGDFGCCLGDKEYGLNMPYFTGNTDRGGNCSLMAPEISTATPGLNVWLDYNKADLWAVGILIYELFGLENPFYVNQSSGVFDSRTYNERDLPPLPGAVPDIVKFLTKSMLCRDPKKRISPVDAAIIMQMYLWCPADWFVYKPNVKEVRGHLLILQGVNDLCPEHQLMSTFLRRHNLNDIIRVLDSFAEVDE